MCALDVYIHFIQQENKTGWKYNYAISSAITGEHLQFHSNSSVKVAFIGTKDSDMIKFLHNYYI